MQQQYDELMAEINRQYSSTQIQQFCDMVQVHDEKREKIEILTCSSTWQQNIK